MIDIVMIKNAPVCKTGVQTLRNLEIAVTVVLGVIELKSGQMIQKGIFKILILPIFVF